MKQRIAQNRLSGRTTPSTPLRGPPIPSELLDNNSSQKQFANLRKTKPKIPEPTSKETDWDLWEVPNGMAGLALPLQMGRLINYM